MIDGLPPVLRTIIPSDLIAGALLGWTSLVSTDGIVEPVDIARAARVKERVAGRMIAEKLAELINDEDLPDRDLVDPPTLSRSEMAERVAEVLRIGIFSTPERAARFKRQPAPREKRMSSRGHPYTRGVHGRSVRTVDGGHQQARLICRCGNHHEIGFRELADSGQMDRKFLQAGWSVDPARCPTCLHPVPKDKTMSANPSPAAIKSQGAMIRMLGDHFDAEKGAFAPEWSDARIAKETGLSPAMVAGVREEAFGALKEPEEVAALARDIAALDEMLVEAARGIETIKTELGGLKNRQAELRRKFAA